MKTYQLLLKNLHIFDPLNGIDMHGDIAIDGGKIAAIESDIPAAHAENCVLFHGETAIPGIIDPHVHVGDIWGSPHSQRMLAKVGVCTALDMAGPLDNVLNLLPENGAGLNIAILQYASPPFTLGDAAPSPEEIRRLVAQSMDGGAYGLKILGGHYPLTPDASRRLIAETLDAGGYIAWHAGTTNKGSNIEGMQEAVECADGRFLHLAHINSYCRGAIHEPMEEVKIATELLIQNPNILSESYLSPLNGTRLTCDSGVPVSKVTCNCLRELGFDPSEKGIEAAFLAEKVYCVIDENRESVRRTGREGLALWRARNTDIGGMFPVNPALPRVALASAKRPGGDFLVDCISTDGGCIPRNVIVEMGLALVALDVISMADFVRKTSWNPSRMLRLPQKGSLAIGNDADVTVLNIPQRNAAATIVNGKVAMLHGDVLGKDTQIICAERGAQAVRDKGLTPYIADPSGAPKIRNSE
jgi:imidazolonepropionase-like amidohydrolase